MTPPPDSILSAPVASPHLPVKEDIDLDSLAHAIRPEALHIDINPLDTATAVLSHPVPHFLGMEPAPRTYNASYDSAVLGAFAILILMLTFTFRPLGRLLTFSARELTGVRRHTNVFDEHTASESRVAIILVVLFCLCAAVITYFGISALFALPLRHTTSTIAALSAVFAAYYIFQLCAYLVVGYAFAPDATGARQWVKGFIASYSFLSLALVLPAVGAMFYPEGALLCAQVGIGLYCLSKLLFIIKGFRIFFNNFSSWLYFILYLCTLEIIPAYVVLIGCLHVVGVDVSPNL